MAGRGPASKNPATRRRRNATPDVRMLRAVDKAPPPELPDDIPWPDRTVAWWEMWTKSPQADELGPTDWDFLLDTALLHADVWSGNLDRMPELRIRVAKFGATPEDRVRLKIQYATLEVGEDAAERAGERRQARRERVPKKDPRELLREA